MSRKSAKSKGYRKAAAKKPYLSGRDIKLLCVIVAILAVCVALLVNYDDGALKMKDGKLPDAGENWLIVNGAASGGKRYYKLGEAGEIEGFTRAAEPLVSDDNLFTLRYTPKDENSPIQSIALGTTAAKADRTAEYYHNLIASLAPGDIQTAKAGDTDYTYFTYQTTFFADEDLTAEDAEKAEAAENTDRYEQALHAYVDAPHNASIGITVVTNAKSEEDFLTDEQLMDYAAKAIEAIQVAAK